MLLIQISLLMEEIIKKPSLLTGDVLGFGLAVDYSVDVPIGSNILKQLSDFIEK